MQSRDDGWLDPVELTDDQHVIAALNGKTAVSDLSQSELELFYDLIGMVEPQPEWRPYFALLRHRGFGACGQPDARRTWGRENAPPDSPDWVEEMLDLFDCLVSKTCGRASAQAVFQAHDIARFLSP